jgi:hypothetical protein
MKYNQFNLLKIKPLSTWRRAVFNLRRRALSLNVVSGMGILSAAYKFPLQPRLHLLPDLINLVIHLSKCKGFAAEIISLLRAISLFNLLSIIVYPPQPLSRYCGTL